MPDHTSIVKASGDVTILQVVPRLQSGGAEQSTCEIAAGLVRAGARSLVASAGGRLEQQLKREGSTLLVMSADSKNPLRMAANVVRLCKYIRSNSVSLIHARSRAPAWSALAAARLCRIPFVTTYHGAHAPAGRLKTVYNGVMARGDVTITNSHYMASRIRGDHVTPPDRIVVIHRGVDLGIFDPSAISDERRSALRAAWGVKQSDRIILVPARVSPRKGQDIVIKAMAQMPAATGHPVCIMVGDDQGHSGYGDSLRALAAETGLTERVRLVGYCCDVPAAYALSEVTLIPSTEPEAFGRAAPEAQSMGSLVIATDLGGAVETVLTPPMVSEDRRTGWRVPPGDARALAEALGNALALPQHRKDMVNAASRQHVQLAFSLQNMVSRTLQVYDGLIGSELAARYNRTINQANVSAY